MNSNAMGRRSIDPMRDPMRFAPAAVRATRLAALLIASALIASTASAQPPAPAADQGTVRTSPANLVGQAERGCFSCHDVASNVPNGPSRQSLWNMTPEKLYEAISTGPKASHISVQTEITNDAQKRAVAELITGRAFAGGPDRSAAAMGNKCAAPLTLDMSKPKWNGFSPDVENKRFQ